MNPKTCVLPIILMCAGMACGQGARAQSAAERAAVQSELWAKETAIYAGRGRGDLAPYLRNTATDFASWAPGARVPVDHAALQASAAQAAKSKEKLDLSFVQLLLNGDTAVIYYRTHMTVKPDGTPVDDHYEVTHTWVREHGQWRVLGGMARLATTPAP